MANLLQYEKSPYLRQHAENPVSWRTWSADAFAAAIKEDKPVFLSIGYSTCHWCHVMAHESFEDKETAEALNRDFIPIKVDREERPDVDAAYMAACIAMNGSGGWPLTVLMTPDQKPFWAGTYLPKRQLVSLLAQVSRLWRENRSRLLTAGDELTHYLQQGESACPGTPSRALVEEGVVLFSQSFDRSWGGFGKAPKFPTPHNLLFLLRYAHLTSNRHALDMADITLEHMIRGGIFDHIGGGFSRYSTDRRWLVPHFEKMLYDNALLVLACTEAFRQARRFCYRETACRTLDYSLRELADPLGGFYCGQDADSDGEEGKYYVFTPHELAAVLGREDAEKFCRWFGITDSGNFEGKNIPHLLDNPDWESEPEEIAALRWKVYSYRRERTQLPLDNKILTAWNGLILAALANAGLILAEPRYLDAAERCAAFMGEYLTAEDGSLLARWCEGEAAHPGKLEDYAFYAWGLLELYGATFQTRYLAEARRLAGILLAVFFDSKQGGFYPYASDGERLITRNKEAYDGAMPSGNAVAALVLSRLARLTGEPRWREALDKQLCYLSGAIADYPAGHSFTLLTLLEELWPTAELVCTASQLPEDLLAFLRESPRTGLTVLLKTLENQECLSELAPFTAAYPIPEKDAMYYLCQNGTCASPVSTIAELKSLYGSCALDTVTSRARTP